MYLWIAFKWEKSYFPLIGFDCNSFNRIVVSSFSASNNFYRITLSKNNVLVADFIPCERINDNVLGFYEVIGKQFYTNAGTGKFLKGNNINNTISCKVAGGSSDIYYGYNQLIRSGDFTDMSEWTSYNCNIETVEDGYIKFWELRVYWIWTGFYSIESGRENKRTWFAWDDFIPWDLE